jgi:hypothetical protein
MAKRIISLRNNEALVKIEGAAGANTIALATDLLGAHEVLNGVTPAVNFAGMTWTSVDGTAIIERGGVVIASTSGCGSLGPNEGFHMDNGGNTTDVVVTTTGEVQIWIKLHKIAGYQTKIQPEQYGSYDDPTSATA